VLLSTTNRKPIIFLTFANAHEGQPGFLRNLAEENRQICAALEPAREICEPLERANATFEDIKKAFLESNDRIAVFHYGGHASSYQLLLEASMGGTLEAANASGIAQFLAQRNGLKLVFLNGCSTQAHVEELQRAGIPAVIATLRPVDDTMARNFAQTFYQSLAVGSSVRAAFLDAQAAIQVGAPGETRKASSTLEETSSGPSDWCLFPDMEDHPATAWTLPELARDPTFGLPAIPRTDLPAKPFRHLSWFRREDAEIFFGRGPSIRDLYERINGDGDPIILLYGQSGVGKSSLLDAGVRPRLEAGFEVRYARRDKDLGLLGTLHAFEQQATSLRDAWLGLEQRLHRPVIIILDQLEEVFTRPNANLPDELDVFLNAVQTLTGNPRPQGKLILGFRKEWLAEIERRLEAHGLPFVKRFLEPLDHDGVIDAIRGPSTSKRLIEKYGLEIHADLPEAIAQDMLEDRGSPVATTLQILLTRMFDEAIKTNNSNPRFDPELYGDLKRRGILLGDFLDQQLEQLSLTHPTESSSGLALDVLAYHTTALGTAEQRGADELKLEYGNRDGLEGLLQALKDLYLLAEASGDGAMPEGGWPTRLSHDTLAPLVRKLFDHSDKPGQRAKRILENRAVEWADGMVGTPLDERDLEVVERGEMGMRASRADEVRMLEVSRDERKNREEEREAQKRNLEVRQVRDRRIFWGGMGLTLVALVLAGLAYWQRGVAVAQTNAALSRQIAAQSQYLVKQDLSLSLLLASQANRMQNSIVTKDILLHTLQSASLTRKILFGHKGFVVDVKYSPDGKMLASSSIDGTIKLWDSLRGNLIRTFQLNKSDSFLYHINFSHEGKMLVLSDESGTIQFWDIGNGGIINTFKVDSGKLVDKHYRKLASNAVFGPRDKTFIVASRGEIKLFDIANSKVLKVFKGHTSDINYIATDSYGKFIASASSDETIRLWSIKNGEIINILNTPSKNITCVQFSPDGNFLASANSFDGLIQLWSVASGKIIKVFKGETDSKSGIISISFDPTGRILAAGGFNKSVQLWDILSGQKIQKIEGHSDTIAGVIFSPSGKTLASASLDRTIRIWNISANQATRVLKGHKANVLGVIFSPDGKTLASHDSDGVIRLWKMNSQVTQILKDNTENISNLAFSPDGKILASANKKIIRLWSTSSGKIVKKILDRADNSLSLSLSPNGKLLASGNEDGTIRFWDINSKKIIKTLKNHAGPVHIITFSSDGKMIVSASDVIGFTSSKGNTIQLWKMVDNKAIQIPKGGIADIESVTFSPDNKMLASAGGMGFNFFDLIDPIRIWNIQKNKLISRLIGHTDTVYSVAFSPDGKMLASVSKDGTTRLWDVLSGQQIGDSLSDPKSSEYYVETVAFSPDGSLLAKGGLDKMIYLYDVSIASWRARACSIANRNLSLAEWNQYIGESTPYEKVCPQFPPGEGAPADSK
jgi:WD40 repeat protein